MHDSGTRQAFASGAVRDTAEDKPRPDLISPQALMRLGRWLYKGAIKYAERNWEAGMPMSRVLASAWRHLLQYQMGETDEDHLVAAFCNLMFLLHYEEMIALGVLPPELDDLPRYAQQGRIAA
jgi:hypothetical protein